MAKQLTFSFEDKEYILEYTRKSVSDMERRGFIASDIERKPMTMLPELFAGAFLAHHKYVKRDTIDKIFNKMTNKDGLIDKLAEMFNEPFTELVEEPEPDEKNVNWTASF